MGRQRRDPAMANTFATSAKGSILDALKDAGSNELAKLAKKLGNDELMAMMGEAKDKRDQLLAFVEQRLAAMGQAQQAELDALKTRQVWWDEVSKGKAGYHLPDPTRWHKAAGLYRKATEALCAGNLGRAADLMKQAIEADRAAHESIPVQVKVPADRRVPTGPPDIAAFVASGEGCPVTNAPRLLEAADRIGSITEHAENVRPWDLLPTHHWWEEVEEDPEKKKDDDKKKKTDA